MSTRSLLAVVSAGLALLAATTTTPAAESAYPNKPIRLIIPFPPGGSADPLGRALGQWFSDKFGVPVVSDNRPGAGTAIAHTMGARAAPDGYTLLLGASSGLTTNPAFGNKLDYDPIKDFSPVGLAAYIPQLVVVHPSVPAKNVKELIAVAKAHPGEINYSTAGRGTVGHLAAELLASVAKIKLTPIHYKSSGLSLTDVIAGQVHFQFPSLPAALQFSRGGKLRMIAQTGDRRSPAAPDVPTMEEQGLKGFVVSSGFALFGLLENIRCQ